MLHSAATSFLSFCYITLEWVSQTSVFPGTTTLSCILYSGTTLFPRQKSQFLAAILILIVGLFFLASGSVASLFLLSSLSSPFCSHGRFLSATTLCNTISSSTDAFIRLSGLSKELEQHSTQFQGYASQAAPLINNLTDVYVETRKILLLVDASQLPSKEMISTLLLHNSNDIMQLTKNLEELRVVIQGGSDQ